MSGFEANTGLNVHNHYGPRYTGSHEGVIKTEGSLNEATVNFDNQQIDLPLYLPEGSYVIEIIETYATGDVTTATVGGDDVSGADGTNAGAVGPVGGELVIEGPTEGTVIVKYRHIAQSGDLPDSPAGE